MMYRSRSWSNEGDIVGHDKFLSWDVYVGNHPRMNEFGPENTSTSAKGGNALRDTTQSSRS